MRVFVVTDNQDYTRRIGEYCKNSGIKQVFDPDEYADIIVCIFELRTSAVVQANCILDRRASKAIILFGKRFTNSEILINFLERHGKPVIPFGEDDDPVKIVIERLILEKNKKWRAHKDGGNHTPLATTS